MKYLFTTIHVFKAAMSFMQPALGIAHKLVASEISKIPRNIPVKYSRMFEKCVKFHHPKTLKAKVISVFPTKLSALR